MTAIFSNSCSLYQSEGRKFLEKNALEFSAQGSQGFSWHFNALQIANPCAELVSHPSLVEKEWSLFETSPDEQLKLYQSEVSGFDVLMHVQMNERDFVCVFPYVSLHQRLNRLEEDSAIGFKIVSDFLQTHH